MPEVVVRKRVARRSGSLGYRFSRWCWRHRPTLAIAAAFAVASLVGLVVLWGGLNAFEGGGGAEPAPVAAPQ